MLVFYKNVILYFFILIKILFNDDMYDLVKNYLKNLDPKNAYFKRVGADEETKVTLPYFWVLYILIPNEKSININKI